MNRKILLIVSACVLSLAFNIRAEQGGSGHYASGMFNDFSTMPPTAPGLVLGNFFLDYDNATFAANKELPLGGAFAAGVTANVQLTAPFAIYAYPFSFANITFSSGIAVPFEWVDVSAKATYDKNRVQITAQKDQKVDGLGDIQLIPILAGWTNGNFEVGGLFNIWAPTGDYDTGALANLGEGYWTFEPMLGFKWLSPKIGTEFTMFHGVDFNTENADANYQSGDIYHVDATLAQHLPLSGGGVVGVGVSAFYLKQFTGDSGSGAKLGSFEAESYGVGPMASFVKKIGKSDLIVDGSWLPQTHTENTTKGSFIWIKVVLLF